MRCFNTEAICVPEEHYSVDVSAKARQIITALIDKHKYFTMNRPRQYGKTSMLAKLEEMLAPSYYALSVSFQDTGQAELADEGAFVSYFIDLLSEVMEDVGFPDSLVAMWNDPTTLGESWNVRSFSYLRRKIRELCKEAERPIVLMIDEVDCASNRQVFLRFLGALRENYIAARKKPSREASFQSVILAGVTDIKNLRGKVRPEEEHRLNSPWNIAADFKVDMSFSAEEIAGMLQEYEADHHTGMDVSAVSQEIRRLTSGYPGELVVQAVGRADQELDRERGADGRGCLSGDPKFALRSHPMECGRVSGFEERTGTDPAVRQGIHICPSSARDRAWNHERGFCRGRWKPCEDLQLAV